MRRVCSAARAAGRFARTARDCRVRSRLGASACAGSAAARFRLARRQRFLRDRSMSSCCARSERTSTRPRSIAHDPWAEGMPLRGFVTLAGCRDRPARARSFSGRRSRRRFVAAIARRETRAHAAVRVLRLARSVCSMKPTAPPRCMRPSAYERSAAACARDRSHRRVRGRMADRRAWTAPAARCIHVLES